MAKKTGKPKTKTSKDKEAPAVEGAPAKCSWCGTDCVPNTSTDGLCADHKPADGDAMFTTYPFGFPPEITCTGCWRKGRGRGDW